MHRLFLLPLQPVLFMPANIIPIVRIFISSFTQIHFKIKIIDQIFILSFQLRVTIRIGNEEKGLTARPTAPNPKTATEEPFVGLATFKVAPRPIHTYTYIYIIRKNIHKCRENRGMSNVMYLWRFHNWEYKLCQEEQGDWFWQRNQHGQQCTHWKWMYQQNDK